MVSPLVANPMAKTSCRMLRLLVLLSVVSSPLFFVGGARLNFNSFTMPKEDPYNVLGVKNKDRNNMDAIKKAYRAKAKKFHPDKNLDMDPEEANNRFHRIVDAWEFLSDKQKKFNYDTRKKRNNTNNRNFKKPQPKRPRAKTTFRNSSPQTRKPHAKQQEENRQKRKDEERARNEFQENVKLAMENLLTMTTMEELVKHKIVDPDTQKFRKHFLCVFVSNKNVERIADNDFLFPTPFGPRGRNGIDWRDLIQTAKVRFNKPTPLTKAFRVPGKLSHPYIVFAKKGSGLDRGKFEFEIFDARNFLRSSKPHQVFERWILDRLKTKVKIVNRNPKGAPPIKVYLDHASNGTSGILRSSGKYIPPGFMLEVDVRISDRLVVLDTTTDDFHGSQPICNLNELHLTEEIVENVAVDNVVIQEVGQIVEIGTGYGTTRTCHDLFTKCHTWLGTNRHPGGSCQSPFAHAMCAKSCQVCIDSPYVSGLKYAIFHVPLHKVPRGLRPVLTPLRQVTSFLQVFGHDFWHIWSVRRNVTAGFFVGGLLLGIQVVLLSRAHLGMSIHRATMEWEKNFLSLVLLGFLLVATGFVASVGFWLSTASAQHVPAFLKSFHHDWFMLRNASADIIIGLFLLGVASLVVSRGLVRLFLRRSRQQPQWLHLGLFLVTALSMSIAMVLGTSLYLNNTKADIRLAFKVHRWNSVWNLQKNVAASIIAFGHLVGMTAIEMGIFVGKRWIRYLPAEYLVYSLVNMAVGCGLLSLAFTDRFFWEDLEHVVSMRMSAAIPCVIAGMGLGLFGAHVATAKKHFDMMTTRRHRQHAEVKVKTD